MNFFRKLFRKLRPYHTGRPSVDINQLSQADKLHCGKQVNIGYTILRMDYADIEEFIADTDVMRDSLIKALVLAEKSENKLGTVLFSLWLEKCSCAQTIARGPVTDQLALLSKEHASLGREKGMAYFYDDFGVLKR